MLLDKLLVPVLIKLSEPKISSRISFQRRPMRSCFVPLRPDRSECTKPYYPWTPSRTWSGRRKNVTAGLRKSSNGIVLWATSACWLVFANDRRKKCCHKFKAGDLFKYMSALIKISNHLALILPGEQCLAMACTESTYSNTICSSTGRFDGTGEHQCPYTGYTLTVCIEDHA